MIFFRIGTLHDLNDGVYLVALPRWVDSSTEIYRDASLWGLKLSGKIETHVFENRSHEEYYRRSALFPCVGL